MVRRTAVFSRHYRSAAGMVRRHGRRLPQEAERRTARCGGLPRQGLPVVPRPLWQRRLRPCPIPAYEEPLSRPARRVRELRQGGDRRLPRQHRRISDPDRRQGARIEDTPEGDEDTDFGCAAACRKRRGILPFGRNTHRSGAAQLAGSRPGITPAVLAAAGIGRMLLSERSRPGQRSVRRQPVRPQHAVRPAFGVRARRHRRRHQAMDNGAERDSAFRKRLRLPQGRLFGNGRQRGYALGKGPDLQPDGRASFRTDFRGRQRHEHQGKLQPRRETPRRRHAA